MRIYDDELNISKKRVDEIVFNTLSTANCKMGVFISKLRFSRVCFFYSFYVNEFLLRCH